MDIVLEELAGELIDGNPVLRARNKHEGGGYYFFYTPKKPIDGHWLTRVTVSSRKDGYTPTPKRDPVVGVTSHEDGIPQKTHESARRYITEEILDDRDNDKIEDRTHYAQTPPKCKPLTKQNREWEKQRLAGPHTGLEGGMG